jgi:hypothetical protein
VLHVSLVYKVFLDHKIFGFVGEVAVHLLLGLAINKIYTKIKIRTNLRKLGLIFEDDQKLVDAKRKTKRKLKIFT